MSVVTTSAGWAGVRRRPAHAATVARRQHPALHYVALTIAVLTGAVSGTAMADVQIAETKVALAGLVVILLAYALHRRPRKS